MVAKVIRELKSISRLNKTFPEAGPYMKKVAGPNPSANFPRYRCLTKPAVGGRQTHFKCLSLGMGTVNSSLLTDEINIACFP